MDNPYPGKPDRSFSSNSWIVYEFDKIQGRYESIHLFSVCTLPIGMGVSE